MASIDLEFSEKHLYIKAKVPRVAIGDSNAKVSRVAIPKISAWPSFYDAILFVCCSTGE